MRTSSDLLPSFSIELLDDVELVTVAVVVVELEDDDLDEPAIAELIVFSVFVPAMPSAERPFARWKAETAASVLLP